MDKTGFYESMTLLKIKNPPEEWSAEWGKINAELKSKNQLHFLRNEYLLEANQYFKLSGEKLDAFYNALELIREREDLISLALLWKNLLYEENINPSVYDVVSWPVPEAAMGSAAGMFPLIVAVSNLPWLIELYKKNKFSETILYDTLSDIGIIMEESRKRKGFWGIESFLLEWLLNHFHGRLFRIGRLQYIPKRNDHRVRVYRHLKSRMVIALAKGGIEYKSDGSLNSLNGVYDENSWFSQLTENNNFIEGNPITPLGKALPQLINLPLTEWRLELQEEDSLLDVHIPRGGKMNYELLVYSYQRALEVFPKLFPGQIFKGFICSTWIFDPQLQEILPEDSNLVKFQSDFYMYRVIDSDSVYHNVFAKKPEDLNALSEETSLQRAVKRHVLSGKQMYSAEGFLLFDDLKRGSAYYQKKQASIQLVMEECKW